MGWTALQYYILCHAEEKQMARILICGKTNNEEIFSLTNDFFVRGMEFE
jgi:hypothetical protein